VAITTLELPDGEVGAAYGASLAASGGVLPYAWSINAGALPDGLTLDPASGGLSGTPTAAGSFAFTAVVTDAVPESDSREFTVVIAEAGSGSDGGAADGGVGDGDGCGCRLGGGGGAAPGAASLGALLSLAALAALGFSRRRRARAAPGAAR